MPNAAPGGHGCARGSRTPPCPPRELEAALAADPDNLRFGSDVPAGGDRRRPAQYDRASSSSRSWWPSTRRLANAYLNYGFAYVDKIPAAGSITQVILANTALTHFTQVARARAELDRFYTRGNSYLFWPKIFGRAPLGVADLEQAMEIQKPDEAARYHVRAFVALGDGYWKTDELEQGAGDLAGRAAAVPRQCAAQGALAREGDELDDATSTSSSIPTSGSTPICSELWEGNE